MAWGKTVQQKVLWKGWIIPCAFIGGVSADTQRAEAFGTTELVAEVKCWAACTASASSAQMNPLCCFLLPVNKSLISPEAAPDKPQERNLLFLPLLFR